MDGSELVPSGFDITMGLIWHDASLEITSCG